MCFRALVFMVCTLAALTPARAARCSYDKPDSFLSRVVAIDSSGGPIYRPVKEGENGNAPSPLELRSKEVVLIFVGGPHSTYTQYILDVLDEHCAKGIFFFSASAALGNSEVMHDVARRGHTLAAEPMGISSAQPAEGMQAAIERSLAAVAKSSGAQVSPFIHAAGAGERPEILDYIKARGVSLWYADLESRDTEPDLTPSTLANRTLLKIREMGKGVIAFHDTRKVTVDCLDSILTGLRLSGFRVIQPVPGAEFVPKEEFMEQLNAKQARAEAPPARASRKLLDEAKRRVLLSERGDFEARRRPRRHDNN